MSNWRQVTESDLLSVLSRAETEAFRQSADFASEPVERDIASEVAFVRGCIRSGGQTKLSDNPSELPESLILPAMNHLRYNLLTRMNKVVNESRKAAWEKAEELFDQVRRGDYTPESAEDDDDTAKAVSPAYAPPVPTHLLD